MKTFEEPGHSQALDLQDQSNNRDTSAQEALSCEQFNATLYAFFGKEVTQEVELGGLEDEDDFPRLESLNDKEYQMSSTVATKEVEHFEAALEVDDRIEVANSVSKPNVMSGETMYRGRVGDLGFPTRDYLYNQVDQCVLNTRFEQEERNWQPELHFPATQGAESKCGYRQAMYPQQQHGSRDQGVLQSSLSSYTSVRSHMQDQRYGQFIRSLAVALPQASVAGPHMCHISESNLYLGGTLPSVQYGGGMPLYNTSSYMISMPVQQGHWLSQPNIHPGGSAVLIPNTMQQQPEASALVPGQLLQQQQGLQFMHGGVPHFPPTQTQQFFNTISSSLPTMHKEGRHRFQHGSQNNRHFFHNISDTNSQAVKNANDCQRFCSKYMTPEEIKSIFRMQFVATHGNDPYVDDYYHQALQAKRVAQTLGKYQFAPSNLRNLRYHTRVAAAPHAYFHVGAFGRVPFCSIDRPRPLLEIEVSNRSCENISESKSRENSLEQEPMLAARIAIEDGLCLLLEVDDIDRLFQVSESQDGGVQLHQRRQILVENLAVSLQLVDLLKEDRNGYSTCLAPKDDLKFLRLTSLPKGRKLLSKYIQLLTPGGELARIVCMAVLRRLRFFFGGLPTDSAAAATTIGLARTVASCVSHMELSALSVCLATVVCSSEQPPLRPLGSSVGDGATVVIKALLERAASLLTDPYFGHPKLNKDLWQASFDAFFSLLSKYCSNKYNSIMNSLISCTANSAAIASAAALAAKEMPVELLRVSLLHANEQQCKLLMDFAQRAMPLSQFNSHTASEENINTPVVQV